MVDFVLTDSLGDTIAASSQNAQRNYVATLVAAGLHRPAGERVLRAARGRRGPLRHVHREIWEPVRANSCPWARSG